MSKASDWSSGKKRFRLSLNGSNIFADACEYGREGIIVLSKGPRHIAKWCTFFSREFLCLIYGPINLKTNEDVLLQRKEKDQARIHGGVRITRSRKDIESTSVNTDSQLLLTRMLSGMKSFGELTCIAQAFIAIRPLVTRHGLLFVKHPCMMHPKSKIKLNVEIKAMLMCPYFISGSCQRGMAYLDDPCHLASVHRT